jgi:hypothetical protein
VKAGRKNICQGTLCLGKVKVSRRPPGDGPSTAPALSSFRFWGFFLLVPLTGVLKWCGGSAPYTPIDLQVSLAPKNGTAPWDEERGPARSGCRRAAAGLVGLQSGGLSAPAAVTAVASTAVGMIRV